MADDRGLIKPTGAPTEYKLDDKILLLYPLRNMDWGRLENWMRSQVISAAKAAIMDDEFTDEQKELILQSTQREAQKISIMSCLLNAAKAGAKANPVLEFLGSIEGMLRSIHLSLRNETGKLIYKLDEVDAMIGNSITILTEMYGIVFGMSFPEPADEKQGDKELAAAQATADEIVKNVQGAENQKQ